MDRIFIDPSWSFKECVKNIRTLKSQYQGVLMSFSFLRNVPEETKFIRQTRNDIYNLQFHKWKIDKLWEYMNDDEEFDVLLYFK